MSASVFYFLCAGNYERVEVPVVLQTARVSKTMPEVREEILHILRIDGVAEGGKRNTGQMPELS
jgi:hypothetical protein